MKIIIKYLDNRSALWVRVIPDFKEGQTEYENLVKWIHVNIGPWRSGRYGRGPLVTVGDGRVVQDTFLFIEKESALAFKLRWA